MIENSIKKVEDGTKIANDTSTALKSIYEEVERVSTLINNIAIASDEQSTGIEQINQGIIQVSTVVQSNSATSEESAAASEELSSQAELLKEQVSMFKLKGNNKSIILNRDKNMNIKSFEGLPTNNINNKKQTQENKQKVTSASGSKKTISLNDNDFGKY
ncbi:MAG: putative sensory transducer protein [Clostridia bacterium]|nr:putative sensory transducer protein [Clostridia bacterium]